MPTVFERIDLGMQGNGLAASIAAEAAKLAQAAQLLRTLIDNPPAALAQLAAGLAEARPRRLW